MLAFLNAIPIIGKLIDLGTAAWNGIAGIIAKKNAQNAVETQAATDTKVATDVATGNVDDLNKELGFDPKTK
jgi:hypothetical protein